MSCSVVVGGNRLEAGLTFPLRSFGSRASGSPGLVVAGDIGGTIGFGFCSGIRARSRFNSGRLGIIDDDGLVSNAVGVGGIDDDFDDVDADRPGGDVFEVDEPRTRNLGSLSLFFIRGSRDRFRVCCCDNRGSIRLSPFSPSLLESFEERVIFRPVIFPVPGIITSLPKTGIEPRNSVFDFPNKRLRVTLGSG